MEILRLAQMGVVFRSISKQMTKMMNAVSHCKFGAQRCPWASMTSYTRGERAIGLSSEAWRGSLVAVRYTDIGRGMSVVGPDMASRY